MGTIETSKYDDQQPWVAIQRNPNSGAGKQSRHLRTLIRELRSLGFRPRLFSQRAELDAAVNDPSRRPLLHGIIAAGGDGTLLDVMNRHPDIPVAIFPLGTENLCAKYLGLPRNGRVVARIVAEAATMRFDVGRLFNQRFMVMASIGFDASVIHAVHAARKGHISRLTYLQPIANCLQRYRYPELRVYVDDETEPVCGRMVVIANLPSYALGLKVASNARADDGILDIRVMKYGSALHMFRYLGLIYYRWHERVKDVIALQGRQVRIESDEPVPIQIDGDPAGFTPAVIEVEANVGQLFVPRGRFP